MSTAGGFDKNPQNINRKGPPKKEWTWSGLLKQAAEEEHESGEPMKIIVARKLFLEAAKGNVPAIKEAMNRMDGMPKQSTDLTTDGEKLSILFDNSLKRKKKK